MGIPNYMSAVLLTRHGGPEALQLRHYVAVPCPEFGQALVKIHAAGINNTDINTRIGWYGSKVAGATAGTTSGAWAGAIQFPRIQGGDFCGTVVAVGQGVDVARIGQRVSAALNLPRPTAENPKGLIAIGSEIDGAFAQFCVMDACDLYDVGASPLTDVEIAAIPCAYGTAEGLLTRADLRTGEHVLVTGASGGVGMAAVQLARLRGAHVTAQTSAAKRGAVIAAGAQMCIDRSEAPSEKSFDVVIDVVGGDGFPALLRALKNGGRYAISGAIAGPIVDADLRDIYLKDLTLLGSTYQSPDVLDRLFSLVNRGAFRPLVSKTYPLDQIATAQADFTAKTMPGKLVLIPPEV
jgi:alcohol dehydrogenase